MLLSLSTPAIFAQEGRTNAELALRALREGFPERVGEIGFADGDWRVDVGGRLFYWASGRLLPAGERHQPERYGSRSFYSIPLRPQAPEELSPQQITGLRERGSGGARIARPDVHDAFTAALYGGNTRVQIEALQKQVVFLGHQVTVHTFLIEALKSVEREIRAWKGGAAFIAGIDTVQGYNWRQIAGTRRLSFHSLGVAIDILPKNQDGKPVYWMWEQQRNPDWMLVPLQARWNPPPEVIDIFRKHGFIWGGNWTLFDNIHFEYRPELLAYTRLLAENSDRGGGDSFHHVYPDGMPDRQ